MTDNAGPSGPTAEQVIAAIETMTPGERRRLIRHMEYPHPWQLGYVMVPEEYFVELVRLTREFWEKIYKPTVREVMRYSNIMAKHQRGPRAKRDRVKARHRIIDSLVEQGFNTGEEILEHLKQQHPELVRKGKSDWIDRGSMMKAYRRSKKRR
jgi:hypothetical protein